MVVLGDISLYTKGVAALACVLSLFEQDLESVERVEKLKEEARRCKKRLEEELKEETCEEV